MSRRWDVCSPRKGREDKTFWHRCGTAFEGQRGINIVFDSLPLPDAEGRVSVSLFEPREQGTQRQSRQQSGGSVDLDDAVPFAPEVR